MRIRFDLKGDGEFRKKLGGHGGGSILTRLKNLSPVYKAWGIETVKWIQLNYRTSGAKVGGWKPLRPLTIQSRRRASDKPLLDTGQLLMQRWSFDVMPWGTAIGHPSAEIVEYHNKGGKRKYPIAPIRKKFLWFGIPPAARRAKKGGGIFAKEVEHPPLPQRRQVPNAKEIMPTLIRVAELFISKAIK